jgi:hypothetical protein
MPLSHIQHAYPKKQFSMGMNAPSSRCLSPDTFRAFALAQRSCSAAGSHHSDGFASPRLLLGQGLASQDECHLATGPMYRILFISPPSDLRIQKYIAAILAASSPCFMFHT